MSSLFSPSFPLPSVTRGPPQHCKSNLHFHHRKASKQNTIKGKENMPAQVYWFSGAGSSSRTGQIKPSPAPCHQQTLQKEVHGYSFPCPPQLSIATNTRVKQPTGQSHPTSQGGSQRPHNPTPCL